MFYKFFDFYISCIILTICIKSQNLTFKEKFSVIDKIIVGAISYTLPNVNTLPSYIFVLYYSTQDILCQVMGNHILHKKINFKFIPISYWQWASMNAFFFAQPPNERTKKNQDVIAYGAKKNCNTFILIVNSFLGIKEIN